MLYVVTARRYACSLIALSTSSSSRHPKIIRFRPENESISLTRPFLPTKLKAGVKSFSLKIAEHIISRQRHECNLDSGIGLRGPLTLLNLSSPCGGKKRLQAPSLSP